MDRSPEQRKLKAALGPSHQDAQDDSWTLSKMASPTSVSLGGDGVELRRRDKQGNEWERLEVIPGSLHMLDTASIPT